MKYIRTKDDKLYNTSELVECEDKRFPNRWFTKNGVPLIAINQADTLEELCDEFVIDGILGTLGRDKFWNTYFSILKEQIIKNKQALYGAIGTSKGLIYVAKLNEKGELKLLWKEQLKKFMVLLKKN